MTKKEFLAANLPYRLKLKAPYGFKPNGKESTGIPRIVYLTGDLYADIENKTFTEDFIPIVRPFNDLVKECVQANYNNGEPFIPALELIKLEEKYNKWVDFAPSVPYYTAILTKPFGQVLRVSKLGRWVIYLSLSELESAKYYIVSQLVEWHFDIANLISKGEAIDVNTLDINPYK